MIRIWAAEVYVSICFNTPEAKEGYEEHRKKKYESLPKDY